MIPNLLHQKVATIELRTKLEGILCEFLAKVHDGNHFDPQYSSIEALEATKQVARIYKALENLP